MSFKPKPWIVQLLYVQQDSARVLDSVWKLVWHSCRKWTSVRGDLAQTLWNWAFIWFAELRISRMALPLTDTGRKGPPKSPIGKLGIICSPEWSNLPRLLEEWLFGPSSESLLSTNIHQRINCCVAGSWTSSEDHLVPNSSPRTLLPETLLWTENNWNQIISCAALWWSASAFFESISSNDYEFPKNRTWIFPLCKFHCCDRHIVAAQ